MCSKYGSVAYTDIKEGDSEVIFHIRPHVYSLHVFIIVPSSIVLSSELAAATVKICIVLYQSASPDSYIHVQRIYMYMYMICMYQWMNLCCCEESTIMQSCEME